MGRNQLKKYNYKENRRKRNLYLFLLVSPTILIVTSFIFLYNSNIVSEMNLITIYVPFMIGLFVLILYIQPRLSLYGMYVEYSLLVHEDQKPISVPRALFTSNWIESLKQAGYIVAQNNQSHLLLYKYSEKLEGLGRSGKTLVFITIAKEDNFDFYSDDLDKAIQAVYINNHKYQKISRQITLQFKKFDTYSDKVAENVETMIMFNTPRQTIVNLTTAYIEDTQSIYGAFPKKKYPNRYAYYALNEIRRISNIKE